MCIICPILKNQKLASVLLTLLCSACIGLSTYMFLNIEIDPGFNWNGWYKEYYEYYAFGVWGSICGWFAGIFGLISWNDMQERNGHISCTLRIHGWCAAISVCTGTAASAWSWYCFMQFASLFSGSSNLKCGEMSCQTISWLWTWENILLTFITIFSATSAFRMMNYGCGCKFCFFPCMCCCQIPIGGSSNSAQPTNTVHPDPTNVVIQPVAVQPVQPNSSYPPQYSQQYPPHMQSFRYSTSSDSSSGSDDSYYITTGTGQVVKMS